MDGPEGRLVMVGRLSTKRTLADDQCIASYKATQNVQLKRPYVFVALQLRFCKTLVFKSVRTNLNKCDRNSEKGARMGLAPTSIFLRQNEPLQAVAI